MPHVDFRKYLNCRRVLIVVCLVILAIIAFRFYHMSVTGYMLPDETYYYDTIALDHKLYENREIFSVIYLLFFGEVKTTSSLALMGAIYTSLWGIGSVFLSYRITQRLGMTDEQKSLLLVSWLLLPVFMIMLPMVTTETMALFFALVGILFILRFHQQGRWTDAFISSLAFVAAYKVREPYLLFCLANLAGVLVSSKRSVRSILAFLIPLVLVAPLGVSLWPIQFGQPVYAYLLRLWASPSSLSPLPPSPTLPPPGHAFTRARVYDWAFHRL